MPAYKQTTSYTIISFSICLCNTMPYGWHTIISNLRIHIQYRKYEINHSRFTLFSVVSVRFGYNLALYNRFNAIIRNENVDKTAHKISVDGSRFGKKKRKINRGMNEAMRVSRKKKFFRKILIRFLCVLGNFWVEHKQIDSFCVCLSLLPSYHCSHAIWYGLHTTCIQVFLVESGWERERVLIFDMAQGTTTLYLLA